MGYSLHLIDLLVKLYRKQLAKVNVIIQGCVLSPYLFNILAEMVIRDLFDGFQDKLQIGGRIFTNLRYADGIILLVILVDRR